MTAPVFELRPVTRDDTDALFATYTDARTWSHLPSGRVLDRSVTAQMVDRWIDEWEATGLSSWSVVIDGSVVGNCGVMPRDGWWNLGFRLSPAVWGSGVASEAARRAVEAGQAHRPAWPVVARSLVTNPASGRVSEKAGLRRLWTGHSVDGPDRVIHADRDLDAELFEAIKALG